MIDNYINKITCGDCYELIKELPDKSIDCIYTDIPYLYDSGGGAKDPSELDARITKKRQELAFISNGIDYSILDEFTRILKKVNIFIWCSKNQLLDILNWGGNTTQKSLYGARLTLNHLPIMYGCLTLSIVYILGKKAFL